MFRLSRWATSREVGPQRRAVHAGIDAADGVDARGPTAHQAAQPRGDAQVLFQAVEAAAAGGEEGEPAGEGRGGRDAGPSAGVGQGGESSAQAEDLLDIGTEPCHHGEGASERGRPLLASDLLLPLQEGLEVVLRDAIDQPLNSAAVVDPAAGGVVEGRGDVDADPPSAERVWR